MLSVVLMFLLLFVFALDFVFEFGNEFLMLLVFATLFVIRFKVLVVFVGGFLLVHVSMLSLRLC